MLRVLARISHPGVWVSVLDEALDFYPSKLGFEVRDDIPRTDVVVGCRGAQDSVRPRLPSPFRVGRS
jgi:catechol 2,3-dioxygenase-like lactoylglutathione lyase family enzyme